jgi:hypothetical protein
MRKCYPLLPRGSDPCRPQSQALTDTRWRSKRPRSSGRHSAPSSISPLTVILLSQQIVFPSSASPTRRPQLDPPLSQTYVWRTRAHAVGQANNGRSLLNLRDRRCCMSVSLLTSRGRHLWPLFVSMVMPTRGPCVFDLEAHPNHNSPTRTADPRSDKRMRNSVSPKQRPALHQATRNKRLDAPLSAPTVALLRLLLEWRPFPPRSLRREAS